MLPSVSAVDDVDVDGQQLGKSCCQHQHTVVDDNNSGKAELLLLDTEGVLALH